MKKAVVAILAVLVVVGIGWYFFPKNAAQAPQTAGTQVFEDTSMGLRFRYADVYEASVQQAGNAERAWQTVVLLPDGYVPPEGGEGPPAISVQDIPNPEGMSLEAWVVGDARSNWKLAPEGAVLGSLVVGGKQAFSYTYSGLYESAAVAVAHGSKIYLFQAGRMLPEDRITKDFADLLRTVQFIDAE